MYRADLLERVAVAGETVVVEPIGNHCRGTTFLNAQGLRSPALEGAVAALAQNTEGIYYGRADVRAESAQALMEGRFSVLEVNGVSSEPGHIYDPSLSIFQCWSELLRHVRCIPPISRALVRKGHAPASLLEVLDRCDQHFTIPPPFNWILRGARSLIRAVQGIRWPRRSWALQQRPDQTVGSR